MAAYSYGGFAPTSSLMQVEETNDIVKIPSLCQTVDVVTSRLRRNMSTESCDPAICDLRNPRDIRNPQKEVLR